jgi:hypothetical protein
MVHSNGFLITGLFLNRMEVKPVRCEVAIVVCPLSGPRRGGVAVKTQVSSEDCCLLEVLGLATLQDAPSQVHVRIRRM